VKRQIREEKEEKILILFFRNSFLVFSGSSLGEYPAVAVVAALKTEIQCVSKISILPW
jgi:hypothetical protein